MIVFLLSIWNCVPDQCFSETDIAEKTEEYIFDASSLSERKIKLWFKIPHYTMFQNSIVITNHQKNVLIHRMSYKIGKKAGI